jgi:hypothetical protein
VSNLTPEEREERRKDLEVAANAMRNMRLTIERVEARLQARREERLNRRRRFRRLLPWTR